MKTYIDATQEAGMTFFKKNLQGPVTMLNMLRFKEVADYSQFPHLAPKNPISGRDAYQAYMEATMPFLKEAGSEVLFAGKGDHFLIGPEQEQWDYVLLVKHASAMRFMEFARNEAYLKIARHRTAALADSRLPPLVDV